MRAYQSTANKGFIKNVGKLATGATLSQLTVVAVAPILTRYYEPDELGSYSLFLSFSLIFVTLASGRYEQAIVLEKDDAASSDAFYFALVLACCFCAIMGLIGIPLATNRPGFPSVIEAILLTFYVLSGSIINILTLYFNRSGWYDRSSVMRMTSTSVVAFLQVAFGVFAQISHGLIVAAVIAQGLVVGLFLRKRPSPPPLTSAIDRFKIVLKSHWHLPSKNLLPSVLDVCSVNLPIFFLSRYFSLVEVGLFSLTIRAISLPISFVGTAVSQVFYQTISKVNESEIRRLFHRTGLQLFLVILLPAIVIMLFAPSLFAIVFGHDWKASGSFAQVLMIPFALRFVVSPLSTVLMVKGRYNQIAAWQVAYFAGTALTLWYFSYLPISKYLVVYAVTEAGFYFVYLLLIKLAISR